MIAAVKDRTAQGTSARELGTFGWRRVAGVVLLPDAEEDRTLHRQQRHDPEDKSSSTLACGVVIYLSRAYTSETNPGSQ